MLYKMWITAEYAFCKWWTALCDFTLPWKSYHYL